MRGRRWFEAHRTAGSSQDIGSLSLNSPSLTHSCRFHMGIIIATAFICRMPSFSAISAGASLAVVVFNPQKLAPISSFVFFFPVPYPSISSSLILSLAFIDSLQRKLHFTLAAHNGSEHWKNQDNLSMWREEESPITERSTPPMVSVYY